MGWESIEAVVRSSIAEVAARGLGGRAVGDPGVPQVFAVVGRRRPACV